MFSDRLSGRDRECASVTRARASSTTPIARIEPLRLHNEGWHSSYNGVVLEDGSANRQGCEASVSGLSAHVAALNGIQAGERWAGYSVAGALPRSSQSAIDSEIYGACA